MNPIETAVAKLHGEPVLELPQDLYIPPDALEVFLDAFEGPLDLLLYLIRKNNLDVLDIPMADLTRQYMGYVDMMRAHQLELAAEYLLMAAELIEIKSRMLLPRPAQVEAEEVDPRAELVRRLLEYEQIKLAALRLDQLPQAERDFALIEIRIEQEIIKRLPEVVAEDLRNAWQELLNRVELNRHHRVTREQLSVREHMTRILRCLQERKLVEFGELFDVAEGVPELVVTFLALLELARENLLEVAQQKAYGPIYVKQSETAPHV